MSNQEPLLEASAILGLINEIEDGFDVNSLVFHEFHVWPYVRNLIITGDRGTIGDGFGTNSENVSRPGKVEPLGRPYQRFAAELRSQADRIVSQADRVFTPELPDEAELLLFSRFGERNVEKNGNISHQIFDSLIDAFEDTYSCTKFQLFRDNKAIIQPFQKSTICADAMPYVSMLSYIEKFLNITHFSRTARLRSRIDDLNRFMARFGDGYTLDPNLVIRRCGLLEAYSTFFCGVLELVKPKAVLSIGHSIVCMGLNLACQVHSVPSVDVQHGAAAYSPANIKWLGWKNVPALGYELLADYFWVWGEQAAQKIGSSFGGAVDRHRPVVGGAPWLAPRQSLVANLPEALQARVEKASKRLLVCLSYLAVDPISDHLIEAMRSGPKSWLWLVRLHPMDKAKSLLKPDLVKRLESEGIDNVEIDESSVVALEDLLSIADHHLTPYSSVAIEATVFGVRSTFVHPKASFFFEEMIESGLFDLALDKDAILNSINREKKEPPVLVQTDVAVAQSVISQVISRNA